MAIKIADINAEHWQDNDDGCPSKRLCPGVELLLASKETTANFHDPGQHLVLVIRGKGRCLIRKSLVAIGAGVMFVVEDGQPVRLTPSKCEELILLHVHQPYIKAETGHRAEAESGEDGPGAMAGEAESVGGSLSAPGTEDSGGDWEMEPVSGPEPRAPQGEAEPALLASDQAEVPDATDTDWEIVAPQPLEPTVEASDPEPAGPFSASPSTTIEPTPVKVQREAGRLRWHFPASPEQPSGSHGR